MDLAIGAMKLPSTHLGGDSGIDKGGHQDSQIKGKIKLSLLNGGKKMKIEGIRTSEKAQLPQHNTQQTDKRMLFDDDLRRSISSIDLATSKINADNILWSKHWHKVANSCASVPESYYSAQTAQVQTNENMQNYFRGCTGGGIIWLRSGSQVSKWHASYLLERIHFGSCSKINHILLWIIALLTLAS